MPNVFSLLRYCIAKSSCCQPAEAGINNNEDHDASTSILSNAKLLHVGAPA
jgi:hypothetical protein